MSLAIFLIIFSIVLFFLAILVYLNFKKSKIKPENLEAIILKVWKDSGLNEKIGELTVQIKEIKKMYKSIEQMLRVPSERGAFGELTLETLLSDQLPPEMFGIRKKILDGKIPDAYIRSTGGIICIDSKFPLENYKKMLEAEDLKEKQEYKEKFLKDVKLHLEKIAKDYVCPEKGSAQFALAYIPSERIYWFLINYAFELLRDYSKKGVQVVSPLTLSHKIELIKTGIHAKKLSEEAEKVKNYIFELSRCFEELDKLWKIFYESHLKSLFGKAEEFNKAYKKLREEFDKIVKFK